MAWGLECECIKHIVVDDLIIIVATYTQALTNISSTSHLPFFTKQSLSPNLHVRQNARFGDRPPKRRETMSNSASVLGDYSAKGNVNNNPRRSATTCSTTTVEVWEIIRYPEFRASPRGRSWKYASSEGKLMSADKQRVLEAPRGKGYCRTTLCVKDCHQTSSTTKGGVIPVLLHRVIAFTFLGDPPAPHFTVDHLDRDRSNNCATNLRWASPTDQLQNRTRRVIHSDGSVEEHEMKRPQNTVTTLGRPKSLQPSSKHTAFTHFVKGLTIEDICRRQSIAPQTAVAYIGQACRQASLEEIKALAGRLRLDDPVVVQRLHGNVQRLNARVGAGTLSQDGYFEAYRRVVTNYVTEGGADWLVVKQVLNTIAASPPFMSKAS